MRITGMLAFVLAASCVMGAAAVLPAAADAGSGAGTGAVSATSAVREYQTRVAALDVPVKREVHSPFRLNGTVLAKTGADWTPAAGVAVGYYYRVLPKGNWVHVASGTTSSRGAFGMTSGLVKLGHLQWQARVAKQQTGGAIYQASVSGTRASFFVDKTYIENVVVEDINGPTAVGAFILDYPSSGGENLASVVGIARLYNRPRGSTTWRYMGSSRVETGSGEGVVSWGLNGSVTGTFKIVFPAQGDFLGSSAEQSLN